MHREFPSNFPRRDERTVAMRQLFDALVAELEDLPFEEPADEPTIVRGEN